jgi:hypothetical protein
MNCVLRLKYVYRYSSMLNVLVQAESIGCHLMFSPSVSHLHVVSMMCNIKKQGVVLFRWGT